MLVKASHRLRSKSREEAASLVVQWLRFKASNAGGMGLIPVQGTKIPRGTWRGQTTVTATKLFKKKFKRRRVCKDRT